VATDTLGLVDFAMFPHLDHEMLPHNSMADAEKWAASMRVPGYAIDDETAIKVVDGPSKLSPKGTGNCSRGDQTGRRGRSTKAGDAIAIRIKDISVT
jgi:hypothetical protein